MVTTKPKVDCLFEVTQRTIAKDFDALKKELKATFEIDLFCTKTGQVYIYHSQLGSRSKAGIKMWCYGFLTARGTHECLIYT